MTREDIEEVAKRYANDVCRTPHYRWGQEQVAMVDFMEGAEWRINSVWHEMCEKTDFSKLPILLQHKNGKIHFIDDIPSSWIYLQKYYTRWAYVKDLIPNMEE